MKICWPRILLWITVGVFALGAALSGCGQKGPLYLPKEDPNKQKQKKVQKQKDSEKKTTEQK